MLFCRASSSTVPQNASPHTKQGKPRSIKTFVSAGCPFSASSTDVSLVISIVNYIQRASKINPETTFFFKVS